MSNTVIVLLFACYMVGVNPTGPSSEMFEFTLFIAASIDIARLLKFILK